MEWTLVLRQFLWSGFRSPTIASESTIREIIGSVNISGAQRSAVLGLLRRQGLLLILAGTVLGVAASVALSRFLARMLFEVTPTDPLTFALVLALLVGVAILACWIPARRAMRVDPMVALRYE